MKKKKIANIIMAAVIVLIAVAGILTAGSIRGWFDKTGEQAVLTEIKGIVNLNRDGVAFRAEQDTPLRDGDTISCDPGATAVIRLDDERWMMIGEKAQVRLDHAGLEGFRAQLLDGESAVFCRSGEKSGGSQGITLQFAEKEVKIDNAAAGFCVHTGAQTMSVYAGTVDGTQSGQMIQWVQDQPQAAQELRIDSLNQFAMDALRKMNAAQETCFTNTMLDKLAQERRTQLQKPEQAATEPTATEPAVSAPTEGTQPGQPQTPEDPDEAPGQSGGSEQSGGSAQQPTQPPATQPPATQPAQTEPPQTEPPETEPVLTCTLSIRCDTILDNMDQLDPAKAGYVPSDGWILYAEMEFSPGETAFDVLRRACSDYGIALEYSYSPSYGSDYVEGINNIYEFDCGPQSGWMYQVDGWFPNYGSSGYTLSGGESITFCYTCTGMGEDVGG